MKDMDVGNALRRLPRTTASPRFTSDVLRNVGRASARLNSDELKPVLHFPWRMLAATAMMLILVAGMYATSVHRERRERINALRAEHQRIESELQRVKAVAEEAQPVVVLENGDTRVIVDVKQSQRSNPIYY